MSGKTETVPTRANDSSTPPPTTSNMSDLSFTQGFNESSSIHAPDLSITTFSSNVTTEHITGGILSSHTAAIAVFVVVMGVAILGLMVFIHYRRKRKLSYLPFPCEKCCMPRRKRHGSTASFNNPLTAADGNDPNEPREREMFSIEDQDGGSDGRIRPRARVNAEDDYFYDEIFERSEFVDERTNKSNKQLTVDDFEDEFDIPDLIFKPPTFKTA